MDEKNDVYFLRLQEWFLSQCNGDWEKKFGIRISTIDNPGWSLWIDLKNTQLENVPFPDKKIDISNDNWILCWLKNNQFQGGGGPLNLLDIIKAFYLHREESIVSKPIPLAINSNYLYLLQEWYKAHCDGDWEHEFGIKIDTLDNSRWVIEIDLKGTECENKVFLKVDNQFEENNSIHCSVKDGKFLGAGGTQNLVDIIRIFIEWQKI